MNITRRLEDTNFILSRQNVQYFTPSLRLFRKILFCHSKIKFISSRQRVISSMSEIHYALPWVQETFHAGFGPGRNPKHCAAPARGTGKTDNEVAKLEKVHKLCTATDYCPLVVWKANYPGRVEWMQYMGWGQPQDFPQLLTASSRGVSFSSGYEVDSCFPMCSPSVHRSKFITIERFRVTFTANGKRQIQVDNFSKWNYQPIKTVQNNSFR